VKRNTPSLLLIGLQHALRLLDPHERTPFPLSTPGPPMAAFDTTGGASAVEASTPVEEELTASLAFHWPTPRDAKICVQGHRYRHREVGGLRKPRVIASRWDTKKVEVYCGWTGEVIQQLPCADVWSVATFEDEGQDRLVLGNENGGMWVLDGDNLALAHQERHHAGPMVTLIYTYESPTDAGEVRGHSQPVLPSTPPPPPGDCSPSFVTPWPLTSVNMSVIVTTST
jgi:hypothetical protein